MDRPRFHPINPALIEPILLWGCERLPLLCGWGLAAALICPTAFQFIVLDLVALVFFPTWYVVCRMMAKRDPRSTQKVLEHMQWADHYFVHAPLEDVPDRAKRMRFWHSLLNRIVGAMYS